MRLKRQNAILSLINDRIIETQKDLSDELQRMGFKVTQATVSRDIKELRLVKAQAPDGRYRYIRPSMHASTESKMRIQTIFSRSVVSVDYALNNVVIKTLSGMAQPAAITLENMNKPEIIGTIAGDDTVLVVVKSESQAEELSKTLQNMING